MAHDRGLFLALPQACDADIPSLRTPRESSSRPAQELQSCCTYLPLVASYLHLRGGAFFIAKMAAKGMGSCRYCGETIEDIKWAPLQCGMCKGLVHLNCVHGERPSACYGDKFFDFTCRNCSRDGNESCSRMSMSW